MVACIRTELTSNYSNWLFERYSEVEHKLIVARHAAAKLQRVGEPSVLPWFQISVGAINALRRNDADALFSFS